MIGAYLRLLNAQYIIWIRIGTQGLASRMRTEVLHGTYTQ
jgi:hypothetical protein